MRVLPAPDDAEYIALSYVWSKCGSSSGVSSLSEQMEPVITVPPTISDAAKLTLGLGKQFLWVDRLCIDDLNLEQKRQQIAFMGKIYQNAGATVAMLDGDETRPSPHRANVWTRGREPRQNPWPSWSWVSARRGVRYDGYMARPARQAIVLSRISIIMGQGILSTDTFFEQAGPPRLIPEQSSYLQIEAVLLPVTKDSRLEYWGKDSVTVPTLKTSLDLQWVHHADYADHDGFHRKGGGTHALAPDKAGHGRLEWYVIWLEVIECEGFWRRTGLIESDVSVLDSREGLPKNEPYVTREELKRGVDATREILAQELSKLPTKTIVLG